MSYYRAPREESLFFRFPEELPIVVSGHPVRDIDLESRVAKALKSEFETNPSWREYKAVNERRWSWSWRGWLPWWSSLRYYLALVVSHAAVFSLGSFAARE